MDESAPRPLDARQPRFNVGGHSSVTDGVTNSRTNRTSPLNLETEEGMRILHEYFVEKNFVEKERDTALTNLRLLLCDARRREERRELDEMREAAYARAELSRWWILGYVWHVGVRYRIVDTVRWAVSPRVTKRLKREQELLKRGSGRIREACAVRLRALWERYSQLIEPDNLSFLGEN
jgi:hypothetical protein